MFKAVCALMISIVCAVANGDAALADGQRVLVQSTTSTQNSGLYDHLLPAFQKETGLRVDVVAVGTGQAIRNARNGDADVLLVHSRQDEEAFVAAGHGVERHDLMYNDFVIVGPAADPAGLSDAPSLPDALSNLAGGRAPFVSRGDASGTHKAELGLWAGEGIRVGTPDEPWYREAGAGMGATLRMTVEMGAYTISDRATWIAFGGKADHRILFEGAPALFNQYGVIALDPARHGHVNAEGAAAFVEWLLSDTGQARIAAYRVDGQQLFFPNAERDLAER